MGFPKGNKQKKNVLCENSVEVRCNDGIYIFPTSDFDGEGAAIEGGGMREEGTLPVEEHLDGEDVPLSQQQQPPDLLVPEETKKNRR